MRFAPSPVRARDLVVRGLWPLWLAAAAAFLCSAVLAPRAARGFEPPAPGGPGLAQLEELQRTFQELVEQVAPGVVGIRAVRPVSSDDPETPLQVVINGSGTVLAERGLILTNEHVIQGATEIDVLFWDGQRLRATVRASDSRSDLAVLEVPRDGLRPVSACDWSTIARGQWVLVLGNPFGLGLDGQLSASVGIIANLGRQLPGLGEVDDRFYYDMIQITAPINPGNSGGPLFNLRGELVGVVTAMHTRAPADEGAGFAVPMTPGRLRIIEQLAAGRSITYGYLGVTVRALQAAERATLAVAGGAVVDAVEPDGPAAHAGVQPGDIVVSFDRQSVRGPSHLAELVGQTLVGATVRLELLRGGAPTELTVVIGERNLAGVVRLRETAATPR